MPLTTTDITTIIGPTDAELIATLMQTGAEPKDLAKAWAWLENEESCVAKGWLPPTGKAAELVDLLTPEEGTN